MWNTKIRLFVEEYLDSRPDGSGLFYKLREAFPPNVMEKVKKLDIETDTAERIKQREQQNKTAFGRRVEGLFRKRLAFKAKVLEQAVEYVNKLSETDPGDGTLSIITLSNRLELLQSTIGKLDTDQIRNERDGLLVLCAEIGYEKELNELYPETTTAVTP